MSIPLPTRCSFRPPTCSPRPRTRPRLRPRTPRPLSRPARLACHRRRFFRRRHRPAARASLRASPSTRASPTWSAAQFAIAPEHLRTDLRFPLSAARSLPANPRRRPPRRHLRGRHSPLARKAAPQPRAIPISCCIRANCAAFSMAGRCSSIRKAASPGRSRRTRPHHCAAGLSLSSSACNSPMCLKYTFGSTPFAFNPSYISRDFRYSAAARFRKSRRCPADVPRPLAHIHQRLGDIHPHFGQFSDRSPTSSRPAGELLIHRRGILQFGQRAVQVALLVQHRSDAVGAAGHRQSPPAYRSGSAFGRLFPQRQRAAVRRRAHRHMLPMRPVTQPRSL